MQIDEHGSKAIKKALETDGAVVRLNWTKCKTAPMLEGTAVAFKLPLGGTWLPIGKSMEATQEAKVVDDDISMSGNSTLGIPEGDVPEKLSAVPDLASDEMKAFSLFADGQQHTRREVEAALDCGEDKAGIILKSLKDKGLLRTVGGGRNTAYTKA